MIVCNYSTNKILTRTLKIVIYTLTYNHVAILRGVKYKV